MTIVVKPSWNQNPNDSLLPTAITIERDRFFKDAGSKVQTLVKRNEI